MHWPMALGNTLMSLNAPHRKMMPRHPDGKADEEDLG